MPNSDEKAPFQSRCARFGGAVLRLIKDFPSGHVKSIVGDQLSRSATGVGSNASEARSAESRADFIHKLQLALKEAREAYFWLMVVRDSGEIDSALVSNLITECDELIAILVVSVNTAKNNLKHGL